MVYLIHVLVGTPQIDPLLTLGEGFMVEAILTFILVFVVFATAVDPGETTGSFGPFAIGLTVLVCHMVGVPLTGCGINPARTFGSATASGEWADHWVYWVGPLVGATFAALVYQIVFLFRIKQVEGSYITRATTKAKEEAKKSSTVANADQPLEMQPLTARPSSAADARRESSMRPGITTV